jgi:hypothetical protein
VIGRVIALVLAALLFFGFGALIAFSFPDNGAMQMLAFVTIFCAAAPLCVLMAIWFERHP